MKRIAVVGMAVVVAVVLGSMGVAMAGDTATVAVSASVSGNCKFVAPKTGALAFGTLDPAVGGNVAGTPTQPQFWCTKGTAYTIVDDFGVNEASAGVAPRRMSNGTDFIPYTFTYTDTGTGAGAGSGNYITMNIAGGVLGADYINVSAGAYTDTVTLTVAP